MNLKIDFFAYNYDRRKYFVSIKFECNMVFLIGLKFLLIAETSAIVSLPDPPGLLCIEDWVNAPKCNDDCIRLGFKKGGIRIDYFDKKYSRCCCYKK
jgi:hypothetical protein